MPVFWPGWSKKMSHNLWTKLGNSGHCVISGSKFHFISEILRQRGLSEHTHHSHTPFCLISNMLGYLLSFKKRNLGRNQIPTKGSMPVFSWSIQIISRLKIHRTAKYNSSKMYLILKNIGLYTTSFLEYDLKHKKRQNNALIT